MKKIGLISSGASARKYNRSEGSVIKDVRHKLVMPNTFWKRMSNTIFVKGAPQKQHIETYSTYSFLLVLCVVS